VGSVVRHVRGRRTRRFKLSRRTGIVVAVLVLFTAVAWLWASRRSDNSSSDLAFSSSDPSQSLASMAAQEALNRPATARRSVRVVYPYSIVPGGVRNPKELLDATAHDPVAARHYAAFDFRKARVVELQESKLVYLSYRMHDKVYWTKKKVSLHKGEKLLTDGKTTARTRCANQVSDQAKPNVSPEEPPAFKFEDPYLADGGTAMHAPFPSDLNSAGLRHIDGLGLGEAGPPPLSGSSLYGGQGGQGFGPIFPPSIPVGGCEPASLEFGEKDSNDEKGETHCPPSPPRSPGPPIAPTPGPPGPPPAPVPEPGTIALVGSGIAGIIYRYRKSNR
jgi:PEP-CTERM motif-containing protein